MISEKFEINDLSNVLYMVPQSITGKRHGRRFHSLIQLLYKFWNLTEFRRDLPDLWPDQNHEHQSLSDQFQKWFNKLAKSKKLKALLSSVTNLKIVTIHDRTSDFAGMFKVLVMLEISKIPSEFCLVTRHGEWLISRRKSDFRNYRPGRLSDNRSQEHVQDLRQIVDLEFSRIHDHIIDPASPFKVLVTSDISKISSNFCSVTGYGDCLNLWVKSDFWKLRQGRLSGKRSPKKSKILDRSVIPNFTVHDQISDIRHVQDSGRVKDLEDLC